VGLQTLENKALSRGIIGKSAPILAEITIRKSQDITNDYRAVYEEVPSSGTETVAYFSLLGTHRELYG
jgi:hypothetical protein